MSYEKRLQKVTEQVERARTRTEITPLMKHIQALPTEDLWALRRALEESLQITNLAITQKGPK